MNDHKELIFFPTWTAGRKGYAARVRSVFEIEKIQDAACRKLGFAVSFHRHEVFGRCKACGERA